ncbi:DoxX family protein [Sinomonas mesophila]|uniref:DoxX family protein n=1 Tax=Sinomonas mesophila TaxID=1531955 RepID=UPI00098669A0|nr:DoxX family protein [Sinomonas mesophila]
MLVALWIINGLLALAFLAAGALKTVRPKEALAGAGMPWVEDFGSRTINLIGLAEVLAAVGLVLPLLLGVAPVLTPLAALGLLIVMIGAAVVHLRRREKAVVPMVLAALAAASTFIGFAVVLG